MGYLGEHNERGMRHGFGIKVWEDGARYEGDWKDGNEHGHGIFEDSNGIRYEGQWADGKKHGYGEHSDVTGTRIAGHMEDGVPDGRVFVTMVDRVAQTMLMEKGQRVSIEEVPELSNDDLHLEVLNLKEQLKKMREYNMKMEVFSDNLVEEE